MAPADSAVTKMARFLDLNPNIPRDRFFVDANENFEAYRAAGFGNMGQFQVAPAKLKNLEAPKLAAATWWRYLTNVNALSPVPSGLRFGEVPQGVLRLGGTFLLDGDAVLFAHADSFPGDYPAISDVLRAGNVSVVEDEEDKRILFDAAA